MFSSPPAGHICKESLLLEAEVKCTSQPWAAEILVNLLMNIKQIQKQEAGINPTTQCNRTDWLHQSGTASQQVQNYFQKYMRVISTSNKALFELLNRRVR